MSEQRRLAARIRRNGVDDERVLDALAHVPRELFVPADLRRRAWEDAALPLGYGATISQPTIVARICAELRLTGGEHVLDVGTGSGYQAAVLAELGADVVGIEHVPELAEGARAALAAAGYAQVEVRVGDGTLGVPERAPFDGIAVAAAAPSPPPELVEQLAPGGRLVIPVGDERGQWLDVVTRGDRGTEVVRTVACRFVPLVGAQGFAGPRSGQIPRT